MQTFNFTKEEFKEIFGYEAPPIFDVKNSDDVVKHLLNCFDNRIYFRELGKASVDWFDNNNGVSLAKQWLDLLNR